MFRFKKIWHRLAFTYGIVFIMAIAIIDTSLIMFYSHHQFRKTQDLYIEVAGIVSQMADKNLKFTNFMNMSSSEENSISGRILLLDSDGMVIVDSSNQFAGSQMTNPQTRKVHATKKTSVGYYKVDKESFAMLAYPILKNSNLSGIVLISYSVGEINEEVLNFAFGVVIISLIVSVIVFIISFYLGLKIKNPINQLTQASTEILNGNTGITVDINSPDEIGTLAKTFNMMSQEIYRTEVGRKRFVSSISHELKTPLASIKALIEPFIGEENIDPLILNEHLKDIDYEIDRLTVMVKSLITTARLEEIKPVLEKFSLCEEIHRIVRILTPLAQDKEISIFVNCPTFKVNTDKSLLREVLTNLIDNGIKYGTQNGHIKINVENTSDKIYIHIIDNGIGIDAKDIPYIFDNFYRADTARSSGFGSGIGLYTVKRITEITGWNIDVKSEAGEGTEFILSL